MRVDLAKKSQRRRLIGSLAVRPVKRQGLRHSRVHLFEPAGDPPMTSRPGGFELAASVPGTYRGRLDPSRASVANVLDVHRAMPMSR